MLPAVRMMGEIMRNEGMVGFYRGISASYLGVTEGVIQWVLYEVGQPLLHTRGQAARWLIATSVGPRFSASKSSRLSRSRASGGPSSPNGRASSAPRAAPRWSRRSSRTRTRCCARASDSPSRARA